MARAGGIPAAVKKLLGAGLLHRDCMTITGRTVPREPSTEYGTLRGHVARANPLWQEFADGGEVLAIFHGPQAYVSPSWYPSKAEHGKVVPTWNYAVVHARGPLAVIDDPAWLRAFVGSLTAAHEAGRQPPWAVDDAPPEFVDQMLGAIVGFEIAITSLVGKWKASPNRSASDRTGVIDGLLREHDDASAALVRDSGS
jgi:transcriptional regulator